MAGLLHLPSNLRPRQDKEKLPLALGGLIRYYKVTLRRLCYKTLQKPNNF